MAKKNKKFGIAFSGGGLKGLAEIGAWKCLEDNDIPFADMAAGTSVGSLIGSAYALGYTSDEIYEYTLGIGLDDFMNYSQPKGEIGSVIKDMILNRGKLFLSRDSARIEKIAVDFYGDKHFSDAKVPFIAVAVDLKQGCEYHIDSGRLALACRASSSLPGVFTPTIINDMILVDGYLLNNLPSDILKQKGMDVVLGIDLGRNSYASCESAKFFDVITASFDLMTSYGKIKNLKYCDVLVNPDLSGYAKLGFNKDNMVDMYNAGYNAMQEKIPELKAALGLEKKRGIRRFFGF